MCDIKQKQSAANGGGINLSMTCKTSGKPITVSNEHGMFCEDMCDLQECKDAKKVLENFIQGFVFNQGL